MDGVPSTESLSINPRFTGRACFPALVDPEPLAWITPDLILDPLRQTDCQAPHILFFIIRAFKSNRLLDDDQVLSLLLIPRRKHRDDRSVGTQRKLREQESRRGRNSKEVDKNRLIIKRVQIGQQSNGSLTGRKILNISRPAESLSIV